MNQNEMIDKIINNTIVLEDGNLKINGNNNGCFFCNKRLKEIVQFKILNENQEYFVSVPMCKSHLKKVSTDIYKYKI